MNTKNDKETGTIQLPWNRLTYQLIAFILILILWIAAWTSFSVRGFVFGDILIHIIWAIFILLQGVVAPHQLANGKLPRYFLGFSRTDMEKRSPGRVVHTTMVLYFIFTISLIVVDLLVWITWLIPYQWSVLIVLIVTVGVFVWYWRKTMSKVENSYGKTTL